MCIRSAFYVSVICAGRYEHGISEGEEPVFFFHSDLIGIHGVLVACKSGYQHDKRAFGQVEIGYQPVQHLELKSGIYEYLSEAVTGADITVKCCNALLNGFTSA